MTHRTFEHLSVADIFRVLDEEASPSEAHTLRAHLAHCTQCNERLADARERLAAVNELYTTEARSPYPSHDRARLKLRQGMETSRSRHSWWRQLIVHRPLISVCAVALLLAAALGWYGERFAAWSPHLEASTKIQSILPDRILTPGSIRPVTIADICTESDDDLDPAVPDDTKRAVLKEYGIVPAVSEKSYQIDYLVNPQLGGTNDIRNLWPQPYQHAAWNARAKDQLEKRLHQMVCNHTVDLTVAQQDIESDWIAAYKKYVVQDDGFDGRAMREM